MITVFIQYIVHCNLEAKPKLMPCDPCPIWASIADVIQFLLFAIMTSMVCT